MRTGFKKFRGPEVISEKELEEYLSSTGLSRPDAPLYVFPTGDTYGRRFNSARSNALFTLDTPGRAVRLDTFLRLAARAKANETNPEFGYDPKTVRSGLALHQIAHPTAYLLLRRREDGALVTARPVREIGPKLRERLGANAPAGDGLPEGFVVVSAEEFRAAEVELTGPKGAEKIVPTAREAAKPAPRLGARPSLPAPAKPTAPAPAAKAPPARERGKPRRASR